MASGQPRFIRSGPVGFGAAGPTWADSAMLPPGAEDLAPFPYPWAVIVTWGLDGDHYVVSGVELRAMHGQPVDAAAWRAVRLAEVVERARRETVALREAVGGLLDRARVPHEPLPEALKTTSQPRRGRPADYTREHYERVARIYTEALTARTRRRSPVRAVAQALAAEFPGLDSSSDNRARGWVRQARRLGLILADDAQTPRPTRGRNERKAGSDDDHTNEA